jgi:hypothetical protein
LNPKALPERGEALSGSCRDSNAVFRYIEKYGEIFPDFGNLRRYFRPCAFYGYGEMDDFAVVEVSQRLLGPNMYYISETEFTGILFPYI